MWKKCLNRSLSLAIVTAFGLGVLNYILGQQAIAGFDRQALAQLDKHYQVTINRDRYGVPHMYGVTDADAVFGLAYAHAEDDYPTIEAGLWFYRGERGRVDGLDGAVTDYIVKWLRINENVATRFSQDLAPETIAIAQAYAHGINFWAAKHPEAVDQRLYPITAQDIVVGFSLQHLLFYGFQNHVLALTQQDEKQQDNSVAMAPFPDKNLPVGSNAFALSPAKTGDGSTHLVMNSHQPLTGAVAWYEAHLQSEQGLNVMGGLFPGSPVVTKGFNENLGWGVTVNKPDLVDVYHLVMHPELEYTYLLDGEWLSLEHAEVPIEIKLLGNLSWTVNRQVFYSKHGPVIKVNDDFYALRYAGRDEIRQLQQWYQMGKAKNYQQWHQAMSMLAISSFNFVYADKDGHIGFFHNAQMPRRKEGVDWQQQLPGDRSDLIWQEYLAFDELPQVVDPSSGYIYSANQSPFNVTAQADNSLADVFSPTLGLQTRMTNRAYRAQELFAEFATVDYQRLKDIKFDGYYSARSRSVLYVNSVLNEVFAESQYQQGQELLKSWDYSTDYQNSATGLAVCVLSEEWKAEQNQTPAPLVSSVFKTCVDNMLARHGKLDVPWSVINRHQRGSVNRAISGGPDVMRAVYGIDDDGDGVLTNVAGDGLVIFSQWHENGGHNSESIHQYGSATSRPESKHYSDQMDDFIDLKLKPTFFDNLALQKNLERSYIPGQE